MIAGRYLRARRKEGAISVIAGFSLVGIMLGVATLIVVMSVMNGFRAELVDRILGAQAHITVIAHDRRTGLADFDALASRVADTPHATRVAPIIERQVLATSPQASRGALVRGMRLEDVQSLDAVANPETAQGDLTRLGEGIALGEGLARNLGVFVGQKIRLTSPDGITTPFGKVPRSKAYEVVYIFRVGMSQYDSAYIFMPLEEAQTFFNMIERADAIEVMVDDPDRVAEIGETVRPVVAGQGFLWDWLQANGAFLGALAVERVVMFIILTLIILVAALNIISGLIMLVKDKGRDIGILRTMGLTRGAGVEGVLHLWRLDRGWWAPFSAWLWACCSRPTSLIFRCLSKPPSA